MKIILFLTFLTLSMQVSAQDYVFKHEGLWLTQNERSAIRVEKCEEGLCGTIAWIIEGGMQHDTKNPDPALRGQPMCGLKIMSGLEQDKKNTNRWSGGKIYKADEGDNYQVNLEYKSSDMVEVRGYVGFSLIGKSQNWTRVSAADYPQCTPATPLEISEEELEKEVVQKKKTLTINE
ncbi:MAG: DUF2147 domain-containing protein, partial [Pseudomonadota bacterium]